MNLVFGWFWNQPVGHDSLSLNKQTGKVSNMAPILAQVLECIRGPCGQFYFVICRFEASTGLVFLGICIINNTQDNTKPEGTWQMEVTCYWVEGLLGFLEEENGNKDLHEGVYSSLLLLNKTHHKSWRDVGDLNSITTVLISSSKGSDALFWPPWVSSTQTVDRYICRRKTHTQR